MTQLLELMVENTMDNVYNIQRGDNMFKDLGISNEVVELINSCEEDCKEEFTKIDKVCELNSLKVLSAFQKNEITESCFNETTGYGYNDLGRGIRICFRQ